jgi:hypothetical protein
VLDEELPQLPVLHASSAVEAGAATAILPSS